MKPGDSCIIQLISVIREVYKSFEKGLDIRSIFAAITKFFGYVWHDSSIDKSKWNDILENFSDTTTDF